MWNALLGSQEGVVENASGVRALEWARFGGGPEDLLLGCAVGWQVVDGFEFGAWLVLGEHGGDGAGVWLREALALGFVSWCERQLVDIERMC